jgi:transposase
VEGALLVKELLGSFKSEHALMPDVRMDVETLLSIKAKAHKLLWSYVVPGTLAMESCSSAHHWGRWFTAHGHTVRLIAPEFVRMVKSGLVAVA